MNARAACMVATIVFVAAARAGTHDCCKNLFSLTGDETYGACNGTTTTACEVGSEADPAGNKPTSARLAICKTYTVDLGGFLVAHCTANPGPGWVKLPGALPDGQCCWAHHPVATQESQAYSIIPCNGPRCPQQP